MGRFHLALNREGMEPGAKFTLARQEECKCGYHISNGNCWCLLCFSACSLTCDLCFTAHAWQVWWHVAVLQREKCFMFIQSNKESNYTWNVEVQGYTENSVIEFFTIHRRDFVCIQHGCGKILESGHLNAVLHNMSKLPDMFSSAMLWLISFIS